MSEENVNVSDAQPSEKAEVSVEDFVSKKAYEDVTKDMHKFKARYKEEAAKRAEYEAMLKAREEEELREKENWQKLSETYKNELEELKTTINTEKQRNREMAVKNALKQELGNIKDEYLSLANLNAIEFTEDGVVDKDSLIEVANQFRQEHGVLIKSTSGGNATSAPASQGQSTQKSLHDMTIEERMQLLKTMKN